MKAVASALAATLGAACAAVVAIWVIMAVRSPPLAFPREIEALPMVFGLASAYSACVGWPAAFIARHNPRMKPRHFAWLGAIAGFWPFFLASYVVNAMTSESGGWKAVLYAALAGTLTGALSGLTFGAVFRRMIPNSSKPKPLRGSA